MPPHIIKVKSMKFIILPLQTLTLLCTILSRQNYDYKTFCHHIFIFVVIYGHKKEMSRDFFLVKSWKNVLCRSSMLQCFIVDRQHDCLMLKCCMFFLKHFSMFMRHSLRVRKLKVMKFPFCLILKLFLSHIEIVLS